MRHLVLGFSFVCVIAFQGLSLCRHKALTLTRPKNYWESGG